MNYTKLAKIAMHRRAMRVDSWGEAGADIQLRQLRWLLFRGAGTSYGHAHNFEALARLEDPRTAFAAAVPLADYESFRPYVMSMTDGARDVLWPGACHNFAQSSGTSGGASKYIPITPDSLHVNHFAGSSDVLAQYLRHFPESRVFDGKSMILGGSFETHLHPKGHNVKVGDLSATLIDSIPGLINLFRIPSKQIALMADWHRKLDLLAEASINANLTSISGVPSWFMRVILRALELSGKRNARELWPNIEVFFHGGISFEPYRAEYDRLFNPDGYPPQMHYFETYNASEGFFATQAARENDGLLMLIDRGIYFEFLPLGASENETTGIEGLQPGKIYELIITSCNGLWRYRIGDTVKVVSTNPVKIRIAGRTKSFINAFGEELMEDNAERAMAAACKAAGAAVANYTAGPVFAHGNRKGFHQWAIEWKNPPTDINLFRDTLDATLKRLNSDYEAKRKDNLFLDPPQIVSMKKGTFDNWLSRRGSGKLGGQRKIPRLRNDRSILDSLIDS